MLRFIGAGSRRRSARRFGFRVNLQTEHVLLAGQADAAWKALSLGNGAPRLGLKFAYGMAAFRGFMNFLDGASLGG